MSPALRAGLDAVTALLALTGAAAALVGSVGLVRFGTSFRRVHAPTLGATLGTWSLTLATVLHLSVVRGDVYLHALLVAVFVAATTPVTTIFTMRAALFRERLAGREPAPEDQRPS